MTTGRDSTALALIDAALAEYQPRAVYALFSGGHDSLTSTHLAARHPAFSGVIHIDTGIGIAETRTFVEETCREQGWPLTVAQSTADYDARCLRMGMPGGPMAHASMYHLLKRQPLKTATKGYRNKPGQRLLLVTGIRHAESERRMRLHPVPLRSEGNRVWLSPILSWTALDCSRYLAEHGVRRNPVVDTLHRSGECLCGALADPKELDWIAAWYPEVAARIRRLEAACFAARLPYRWGQKQSQPFSDNQPELPMCASCVTKWDMPAEVAA